MERETLFEGDRRNVAPQSLIRHLKIAGRPLSIRAGQMVVLHGARDRDVYFIESGSFEVAITARDGQAVVVRDLGPGEIFGDLAAVADRPRSASVTATDIGRIVAISEERFLDAVAQDPESSSWFMRRLAREIGRLTEKVFELTALSARDRLHCELLRLCVGLPIDDGKAAIGRAPTHETIAARIGSQRETVSREMSKLAARGIVQKQGASLLVDLERLSAQVMAELGHPSAS
jgi:CRP-like cAMP-binding protein